MDGCGARIRMTKANIKKLLEAGVFTLCEKQEENSKPKAEPIMLLKQDDTMELEFKDVLYFQTSDKTQSARLKYNTMTNNQISRSEVEKYCADNIGFCKGLIWYYEKETRLLVKLKGDAVRCLEEGKKYVITLKISEALRKKLNIDFAPEVVNITEATSKWPHIAEHIIETSRVKLSDYKGTVKMNLCQKCQRSKPQ